MRKYKSDHNPDFTEWHRQSDVGTFVEFFFLLKKMVRAFIPLLLYFVFTLEWRYYIWLGLAMFMGMAALVLFSYLSYRHTKFSIDPVSKEFTLLKGIFNKSKVSIRLDKIIQVNINQNFIQRMAGVYSVEIETAGTVQSEAHIRALDQHIAFALKEELLSDHDVAVSDEREDTAVHDSDARYEDRPDVIRIRIVQLLKYAFTADYVRSTLILVGVVISFLSRIEDYYEGFSRYEQEIENAASEYFEIRFIILFIVLLFAVSILVNAIRNIITYYQMDIRLEKGKTWIRYGFFSRKNTVLQNDRTQIVAISANPLQKFFKVFKFRISQISSDIDVDQKAHVMMAGADIHQAGKIFRHIYGQELPEGGEEGYKANGRIALQPFILFGLLPLLSGIVAFYTDRMDLLSLIILSSVYVPVLGYMVLRYVRYYRLVLQDDFIIKRVNVWTDRREIIHISKIQAVHISQYAWQKKAGLANLILQTAGGRVAFRFGEQAALQQLANYLLYRLESGSCAASGS